MNLLQTSHCKDIRCQWRRCRGSLTPKDFKIHGSEAEIYAIAVESLGRMNEEGSIFEGDRQASDDDFG